MLFSKCVDPVLTLTVDPVGMWLPNRCTDEVQTPRHVCSFLQLPPKSVSNKFSQPMMSLEKPYSDEAIPTARSCQTLSVDYMNAVAMTFSMDTAPILLGSIRACP